MDVVMMAIRLPQQALEEILDVYGEPWMITKLEQAAIPYYPRIYH
jgi:hypothetical protein